MTSTDVIRHNTIDCRGCSNAAIFYASDWRGTLVLDNNLLSGGGYTLRVHESGQAWVTDNKIVRNSYQYGPTYNAYGNIVQWTGNAFSDNGQLIGK